MNSNHSTLPFDLDLSGIPVNIKTGKVDSVSGNSIKALIPNPKLGEIVLIEANEREIPAKITAFNGHMAILTPMGSIKQIYPAARIKNGTNKSKLNFSKNLIGNVLDAFGNLLTHNFPTNNQLNFIEKFGVETQPPKKFLERLPIKDLILTGIKSIDAFLTLGMGQRIIALAEPGIGKSSLLLKIAENSNADLIVIALIGERGREVTELYEELKSTQAINKTIVIASTSDEPATLRAEAAETAFRIAELAAEQGLNVFVAFDSLTRYLRSLRDIGLSAGEIPVRRGYPASVFEEIPKLIERSGNFDKGSITTIFTMLDTSELDEDPFIQEVKGLTDGHIILSRQLAERGHFPAIDIRKSLSRLHKRFWDIETLKKVTELKRIYCEGEDNSDLLLVSQDIEGYKKVKINQELIEKFLVQSESSHSQTQLAEEIENLYQQLI